MAALGAGLKEGLGNVRLFLQEAWAELRRVQWPARKEVQTATAVVIVLVGIVAVFLFLVDAFLSWLLQIFLSR